MNYFAIGHSSRCFSYVRRWVEKKIRRHLMRARQRRGFGWKRVEYEVAVRTAGTVRRLPSSPMAAGRWESAPDRIGHIILDAKQTGKRSAGNPHAAFEEAGTGNVTMEPDCGPTRKWLELPPDPSVGAPVLDPTSAATRGATGRRGSLADAQCGTLALVEHVNGCN